MSAKEKGRGEKTVLGGLTLSCSRSTQFYGMKRDLNSIFSVSSWTRRGREAPCIWQAEARREVPISGRLMEWSSALQRHRALLELKLWQIGGLMCSASKGQMLFFFSFSLPLAPSFPTLGLQMTAVGHLTKCPLDCCFTTGAPSDQTAHSPFNASLPLKISYSAQGYSWLP